jgi:hypothetical protein
MAAEAGINSTTERTAALNCCYRCCQVICHVALIKQLLPLAATQDFHLAV